MINSRVLLRSSNSNSFFHLRFVQNANVVNYLNNDLVCPEIAYDRENTLPLHHIALELLYGTRKKPHGVWQFSMWLLTLRRSFSCVVILLQ
ncbi:hypothetical protein DCC62_19005 [candidate division KSB1 bacterium]|nr:MAG: hypothetical protein DCC62_19005 [candidate division KSB1 bacterium]